MANLVGNSLFTGAISGLNSNYLLMLNGSSDGLSLNDIINHKSDNNAFNNVNQTFRSYLMSNFSQIDTDGDGKITTQDVTNYSNKLQTQGMTYAELSQLCSTNNGTMSSLLDTVLSNFNEIDTNHDGRVTQSEINAYRINEEIKDVKDRYKRIDPTKMSMFIETDVKDDTKETTKTDKVIS